jgi:hypothetical protein
MTTSADNTILAAIATDTLPWLTDADALRTALPTELTDLSSEESSDARDPLIVAGDGATAQPVFDALNATILELHDEMVLAGATVGLGAAVSGITKLGESAGPSAIGEQPNRFGESNLVTDLVNAGSDVSRGDTDELVADIGRDLGQSLPWAHSVKDTLIFGSADDTNVVPELISATGDALQSTPLVTLSGNGLLGGTVGDLSRSSSGHLIDIDIGPTGENGLAVDVLSRATGGMTHTLEVNVLDVQSNGPSLLDLDILTGNGLFGHDPLALC